MHILCGHVKKKLDIKIAGFLWISQVSSPQKYYKSSKTKSNSNTIEHMVYEICYL